MSPSGHSEILNTADPGSKYNIHFRNDLTEYVPIIM